MKAFLILEDGTLFEGIHIGARKEIISEIVFNTSMAGYLEVLTDPSYAGQAVCMTYPLIGNYGICKEDLESRKAWPDGFIVRELSRMPSNFRCDMSIQEFLEENGVPGIAGIDTRALTKLLREKGTMNGMITTNENYNLDEIIPKLKAYTTGKVVERVSCTEKYTLQGTKELAQNGPLSGSASFKKEDFEAGIREKKPSLVRDLNGAGLKVALLDLGAKDNIARSLAARGCDVTVYPAQTSAAARANSMEWFRQSMQMATPRCLPSSPSAQITSAKPWVAQRMTWMFMRYSPTPMVPRRPAVPNSSWEKKRDSISFSSPAMAVSSAFSASDRAGEFSHCSYAFL